MAYILPFPQTQLTLYTKVMSGCITKMQPPILLISFSYFTFLQRVSLSMDFTQLYCVFSLSSSLEYKLHEGQGCLIYSLCVPNA